MLYPYGVCEEAGERGLQTRREGQRGSEARMAQRLRGPHARQQLQWRHRTPHSSRAYRAAHAHEQTTRRVAPRQRTHTGLHTNKSTRATKLNETPVIAISRLFAKVYH